MKLSPFTVVVALATVLALASAVPTAQSTADYQALRKEVDLLRQRMAELTKEIEALKTGRPAAPPAASASGITTVTDVVLDLDKAPMKGSSSAKVTLAEVSDFECPFCGRFARDTAPGLVKEYVDTGKLRIAFVHLPLPNHKFALKAHEAAACAGDQGKFWEMYKALFARQGTALAPALLPGKGEAIGLNQAQYTSCLERGTHQAAIQADIAMVRRYGLSGTPTFYVGTLVPGSKQLRATRRIVGSKPLVTFRQVLDELIAQADAAGR